MTKVLKLGLIGRFQASLNGHLLDTLVSGKAQALLAYLAVDGRSHSRQALAGLLWGELPEDDARRNLRGVLMKLREALLEPYLTVTHQTITFNPTNAHWVDVLKFRSLVGQRGHTNNLEQLQEAVSLYRGEFLEDFYVRQAPLFEEWVTRLRRELHESALWVCQELATVYTRQHEYGKGIEYARRMLELEPTHEEGHRQLMNLLALSGNRSAALSQFEVCRGLLTAELGVAPSAETIALYEQIRQGQPGQETAPKWQGDNNKHSVVTTLDTPPLFMAGPPITHPTRFFGRERELKRLFGLLRQVPLQNSAVIGPRRSGKTSLLHYLKTITTSPTTQLRPNQRTDWLTQPDRYRWIFVDFQDSRLGSREGLMQYLLNHMGLPPLPVCTLDHFLDAVSDNLKSPTIILFDEIEVALQRYTELDDPFWESLRSLATNQTNGNLAFVLTATDSPETLASHRGYGSPFFNIFGYVATLGPLTEAEAHELIASSSIPFADEDTAWITAESGRWPMLLQLLCRERLLSLEDGETSNEWRADALRQIEPFRRTLTP